MPERSGLGVSRRHDVPQRHRVQQQGQLLVRLLVDGGCRDVHPAVQQRRQGRVPERPELLRPHGLPGQPVLLWGHLRGRERDVLDALREPVVGSVPGNAELLRVRDGLRVGRESVPSDVPAEFSVIVQLRNRQYPVGSDRVC